MNRLDALRTKLVEAQLVVEALEAALRRKLVDDGRVPLAAVRKLSAARAEVRRLSAMVRAGRVDQVEEIHNATYF